MKYLKLLIPVLLITLTGCLEMDGFLANERSIDKYTLPGNTIPKHLIERVTLSSEGKTIYGFWVESKKKSNITILYFHGNKHHIDEYWDRVMYLHKLGVNLFIFDYRGFGRSEGTFSEKAMLADARTALNHVLSRQEVSRDSLGLYGYSLGNVASIYLAAEVTDPLFLVAESAFASANSLIQGASHLPFPKGWLTRGTYDNAARIKKIDTPFLLLHGTADDFVRYRDNGKVVYENAPEPKRLQLVEGAKHNNIPKTLGLDTYRSIIRDWILFSLSHRLP